MANDLIWYFDFISPFAYLQLPRMRELALEHSITPRPVVLAAVLKHHGQLGPAEIPGKREFTYRMVQWTAESERMPLRFPPAHPFNSLAVLRLAIASGSNWAAIGAIFDHIWMHGRPAENADDLAGLAHALGIADIGAAVTSAAVKEELRANTEEAIASAVFGVPTVRAGHELFWGHDATPMLEKFLSDPAHFDSDEYKRLASLPSTAQRLR